MVSFIIPAHNEEAFLGQCIAAIRTAMHRVTRPYEIIVVDDSSTDRTNSVAVGHGARVVGVEHRQISKTRNSGARVANGEFLFFVDADTLIDARIVESALAVLDANHSGGGCIPRFDGKLPLWLRITYPLFELVVRTFRQPGGSCLFCKRDAFEQIGGFSEEHFATEDAVFVSALKKLNGFVVLPGEVVTSGRKFRSFSMWSFLRLVLRLLVMGPNGFRDKKGLEMWYGPAHK